MVLFQRNIRITYFFVVKITIMLFKSTVLPEKACQSMPISSDTLGVPQTASRTPMLISQPLGGGGACSQGRIWYRCTGTFSIYYAVPPPPCWWKKRSRTPDSSDTETKWKRPPKYRATPYPINQADLSSHLQQWKPNPSLPEGSKRNSLTLLSINKGDSMLQNRKLKISNLLVKYKPQVLSLN